MKNEIQFIFPRHEKGGGTMFGILPSLGLESMAHYLEALFPDLKIRIFDENITDMQKILNEMPENGIVGISLWYSNASRLNLFAKSAKEKGNRIVVGGPHAYGYCDLIAKNENVDYVVRGDGEDAIRKIILSSRVPGKSKIVEAERFNINNLPDIDFRHTENVDEYAFRKNRGNATFSKCLLTTASIRGCVKATKQGRCSFCSIPYCKVVLQKPEKFWNQVKHFNSLYGISNFFETGDVFSVGNYPIEIAATKPSNIQINLGVHERVDGFSEKVYAKVAKRIGIKLVFLGVEHVNSEMLKNMSKGANYTKEVVKRKIRFLEKLEIKVAPAFIFGTPGESLETAKENLAAIKEILLDFNNIDYVTISQFYPHRGTSSFDMLLKNPDFLRTYRNKTGKDFKTDEEVDDAIFLREFLSHFCKIDPESLEKIIDEAKSNVRNILGERIYQHIE